MNGGKVLSPYVSIESFKRPLYWSLSAWTEHVPFAFWLVSTIKPRMIVELGVHYGMSYFAFCQAVKENGLNTICYGVDTWKGDEHAGFYDDNVFLHVDYHNRDRYSAFSYLHRSTFDEAVSGFLDGSIDLLHIDGRHFYEDVRSDFDTWLPKMSSSGVVLFHDITVIERGFGVYKFWEELKAKYPSFSFVHGHGLGVLAVGKDILKSLAPLFKIDEEDASTIRNTYSTLGNFLTVKKEHDENIGHITHLSSMNLELNNKIAPLTEQNDRLTAQNGELNNQIVQLHSQIGQFTEQNVRLNDQVAQLHSQIGQLTEKNGQLNDQITENNSQFEKLSILENERNELINQNFQLSGVNNHNAELQSRISVLENNKEDQERSVSDLKITIEEKLTLIEGLNCKIEEMNNKVNEVKLAREEIRITLDRTLEEKFKDEKQNSEKAYQLEKAIEELKTKISDAEKSFEEEKEKYQRVNEDLKLLEHKERNASNQLGISEKKLDELAELNKELKKSIAWYKASYEERSILGIIKEKLRSGKK